MALEFEHITAETPIIGFTGALGSGCTYLSEGLEQHHGYLHIPLSDFIHEVAESVGEDTPQRRQDIGNMLRREQGLDILVKVALEKADRLWGEKNKMPPKGIILDGIRNTGEVEALRQLPNFYLIAVHAKPEIRKGRLVDASHRFPDEATFLAVDRRDKEERVVHGQQVKRCNDLADIIILNDKKEVSPTAGGPHEEYIGELLFVPYISLIERIASGARRPDTTPKPMEVFMTAAYVESRRSSCLKRKVGAIITTAGGEMVAAGHNDVPPGATPCLEHPLYGWCARDLTLEGLGQKFNNCPRCGEPIKIQCQCVECGEELQSFYRKCPKCSGNPGIEYTCPRPSCEAKIFEEFLPGKSAETGRLLDMCRSLHAEQNAILNLSKSGASVPSNAVLYSTTFPCNMCANQIVQVGIKEVVYTEPYITREAQGIFKGEVKLTEFEGVKSTAFFRLYS